MIDAARLGVALAMAMALAACGGSDKSDRRPGGNTSRPGMGASTARPTGLAYSLPAGVALDGELLELYSDERCAAAVPVGDGILVELCFALENTTGSTIVVRLPPGLVFVSDSLEYQNGVILQEVAIEVPGGEVVVVALGTHCLNLGRDIPGDGAVYELGPITQDAQLQEIAALIAGKAIDFTNSFVVQDAVWEVTDGDGLTDETREALEAL